MGDTVRTESVKETKIIDLGKIDLSAPLPRRKHIYRKESSHDTSDKIHQKTASLTESELFVLKALLFDNVKEQTFKTEDKPESGAMYSGSNSCGVLPSNRHHHHHHYHHRPPRDSPFNHVLTELSDKMLLSVPKHIPDHTEVESTKPKKIPMPLRPSNHGLWLAHADGVDPKRLISLGRNILGRSDTDEPFPDSKVKHDAMKVIRRRSSHGVRERNHMTHSHNSSLRKSNKLPPSRCHSNGYHNNHGFSDDSDNDELEFDLVSDEEIRPEDVLCQDDSSWYSHQMDANHREYDTWEVLKDEYSTEFGFNYTAFGANSDSSDDHPINSFQILGTSPDDPECQPHVMSPPMMDALMNFLPDNLLGQNFWLRFSLVRDGANLDTLKRYVRASTHTLIAIETPEGEVFGSYTSSPWKRTYGFFGSAPAFVWKMRHSRQTPCHSLFDQAHLESEIDIFMADGENDHIQLCRHNAIAVGGDQDLPPLDELDTNSETLDVAMNSGFAIYLDDDLMRGSSSLCSTFHNPSLCGAGDETTVFDVAGLEVWTLTPCFDLPSAEKLEMTKFFLEEQSTRSMSSIGSNFPDRPSLSSRSSSFFTENSQENFYRRVGQDAESELRRDRWQYLSTMNGGFNERNQGLSATPHFL